MKCVKITLGDIYEGKYINRKIYRFCSTDYKITNLPCQNQKEHIISKQIVRSGTSIGANINEANYGQSKADFISKLHIALKETAETEYWLRLLEKSEILATNEEDSLLKDCLEIKRLLIASINTAKNNNDSKNS